MSSDSPKQPKPVSSQIGRQWLENASDFSTPEGPLDISHGQAIVVSIPDVGSTLASGFNEFPPGIDADPEAIAEALSKATEQRLKEISDALMDQTDDFPVADLPEKTADWSEKNHPNDTERSGEKAKKSTAHNEAISQFVDVILERFPISQPVVLLFVGSESNPHTDETCARVSSFLADRNVGRILLLDSDLEGQELSNASGQRGASGISDVVNLAVPWKSVVCKSPNGLDFLPSGVQAFCNPSGKKILRESVAEMKTEYQFICVVAGDAHSPSARIWNDICDGSYLLVSMKNSNESIAKSAVAELQASGARLLGCVVTDA